MNCFINLTICVNNKYILSLIYFEITNRGWVKRVMDIEFVCMSSFIHNGEYFHQLYDMVYYE